MTRRPGSSPAPDAAWASSSPRPRWPPATTSSPPAATLTPSHRPSATPTTCWLSRSTSPAGGTPRRRPGRPSTASAASTCLVNNAASFYAGYFEELTPEQMERQLTTSLIGPMNVTRAVLPVMRKQRSGHVITISSSAGFAGFEYGTAYAASKFGVDGWMESLAPEVEPFGIHTTIVNPGFFRTELLTKESTNYAEPSIEDYAERQRRPARVLGEPERPTDRRPGQARPGATNHRRPRAAAAPLHRRRRRNRAGRAAGRAVPGGDRRPPRPLVVARARRGRDRRGRELNTLPVRFGAEARATTLRLMPHASTANLLRHQGATPHEARFARRT